MLPEVSHQLASQLGGIGDGDAVVVDRHARRLQQLLAVRCHGDRLAVPPGFMDETLSQRLGSKCFADTGRHQHGGVHAHDTGASPLFPKNCLHADTGAKVWSVRDWNSCHAIRQE